MARRRGGHVHFQLICVRMSVDVCVDVRECVRGCRVRVRESGDDQADNSAEDRRGGERRDDEESIYN